MSVITMTATYVYQGLTYTNGQTYQVRSKDAEAIIAANKANKNAKKSIKKNLP